MITVTDIDWAILIGNLDKKAELFYVKTIALALDLVK